jgi:hypothetical protein
MPLLLLGLVLPPPLLLGSRHLLLLPMLLLLLSGLFPVLHQPLLLSWLWRSHIRFPPSLPGSSR